MAKAAPKLQVATFALPATDNPADRKATGQPRPRAVDPQTGCRAPGGGTPFLSYLMSPTVMNKYNQDNLAYSPVTDAPPVKRRADRRARSPTCSVDVLPGCRATYVPPIIPLGNYLQDLVLHRGRRPCSCASSTTTGRRLAQRTSV